jgi:hypothetical protein
MSCCRENSVYFLYFSDISHCQQVEDSWGWKKGVGVAENPRSGVGARGSSVKKSRIYGKICYTLPSIALPLLNLLIVDISRLVVGIIKKNDGIFLHNAVIITIGLFDNPVSCRGL